MQSDNIINISIKEFFWSVLEQWKPVLLVGLAFAVVFPLILSLKDKKDASDRAAAQAQYAGLSRYELLDKLDEDSRHDVLTAAYQAGIISSIDNYNANSLLSHIDINNAKTLHMRWVVLDSDMSPEIASSYCALLSDPVTSDAVRKGLGDAFTGIDEVYIKELIKLENEGSSFDVQVYIPQGADEEGLHNALLGRVEDATGSLNGKIGPHRLVSVLDETVYTGDPELAEQIINRNNSLELLRDTYRTELLTFSDLQINILNSLNSGEDVSVHSEVTSNITVFTAGRIVIGFVIGVFIYVFVLLMLVLFSSRLQTGDQLNKSYRIRLLGKSSRYGYKGIGSFIHSKLVYNLHNKAYQGDEVTDSIISSVVQNCRFNEVDALSFVVTGDIKDSKRIEKIAGKLKKAAGITVQVVRGDITDKDLGNAGAVVLCVEQNVTGYKDIQSVLELCGVYDRPVIGGICLL